MVELGDVVVVLEVDEWFLDDVVELDFVCVFDLESVMLCVVYFVVYVVDEL